MVMTMTMTDSGSSAGCRFLGNVGGCTGNMGELKTRMDG